MHELIANLHMHTKYSDGHGNHHEIKKAALDERIDIVIVTDHNIHVSGLEPYLKDGENQVLMLVGEEIHDQSQTPQKNHLLVFGTENEYATLAWDPQALINKVNQIGGLSFIAHPVDPASPAVNEDDISWIDWSVSGFTGLELWNAMSEFKSLLKSKLHAVFYSYFPNRIAHKPFPETMKIWDQLLNSGQRVVAVGGSDAHALPASLGPLHKILFPYKLHFRCINTHILTNGPLQGDYEYDKQLVLRSLARGRAFIGYDLPASTRGFRFTAHGLSKIAVMGEEISAQGGITFQIHLPIPTECRLLRSGQVIKEWKENKTCTFISSEPGIYRVEAYIHYKNQRRGWIFSNPIYVRG